MKILSRTLAPVLGIVLLAAATDAAALRKNVFISAMTPSQETADPTVGSGNASPSCLATFELVARGTILNYVIRCYRITGVTAAHIHAPASADSDASPMVDLFSDSGTGPINGELTRGSIVRGTDLSDADFAELIQLMRTDMAYVNVHTVVNPGGEVRGQVTGLALPAEYVVDIF